MIRRVLTAREMQVLMRMAWGLTNPQIATDMNISEETVKTYVKKILAKVGVGNRASLTRVAYDSGLIQPSGMPWPSERPLLDHLAERLESLHEELSRMLARVLWLEQYRALAPQEVPRALEVLRQQIQAARRSTAELKGRAHVNRVQ